MKLGRLARTDFLLFTAARVAGIGIRPLILFLAATAGFVEFSDAFALFATAVAGSFVVFGNEAHIRLYRARFNGNQDIVRLYTATRFFVLNATSHVVWFALAGAVLLFVWTGEVWLSAFGLIVLFAEKIYDEYQRYYTFQRAYIKWTIGFGFRYGVPGSAVLLPILFGLEPSLGLYVAAYILACIAYVLVWERRSMSFYHRVFRRNWRGGTVLLSYVRTYARELYANQAWSFLAANFYLLDRMMINQSAIGLGNYVFFCNLFNIAVFTHTTLYYIHRRADLIDNKATLRTEFFRLPNLVPPAAYTIAVAVISWGLTQYQATYADIDPMLILGLAVYFLAQAVSLVVIDFTFWRVRREALLVADLVLGGSVMIAFFALSLPAVFVPLLMTCLIVARILAYALLWRSSGARIAS